MKPSLMSETPRLPLTLPDGSALPPPPAERWREHTGSTLAKHYPEARAAALEMIREGTNLSDVARAIAPLCGKDPKEEGQVDGLRKSIRGWVIAAGIDMTEIARLKAALLRDEALEAGLNLTRNAKARDLGAVAMMLTQANQVERNLGGLPTEIKVTTKLTLADLEQFKNPTPPMREVTPEHHE